MKNDNYEITDIKEIQDIAYGILIKFHEFCEEHNLRYVLAGGTLLGAIRHQDFIPWDDDIDVLMPRPDYERLLDLTKKCKIAGNLEILHKDNMSPAFFAYAKVIDTRTVLYEEINIKNELGIYIDIFPTDGLPKNEEDVKRQFVELKKIRNLMALKTQKIRVGKRKIMWLVKVCVFPIARKVLNIEKLVNKLDSIAKQYPFEESDKIAFQVLGYGEKEITSRKEFTNRKKWMFREKEFYVPSNYDVYLSSLFGNYMQLPPEKDRIPHHAYRAYWVNKEDNKWL